MAGLWGAGRGLSSALAEVRSAVVAGATLQDRHEGVHWVSDILGRRIASRAPKRGSTGAWESILGSEVPAFGLAGNAWYYPHETGRYHAPDWLLAGHGDTPRPPSCSCLKKCEPARMSRAGALRSAEQLILPAASRPQARSPADPLQLDPARGITRALLALVLRRSTRAWVPGR